MSINTGHYKRLYVCRTPGTWASTLAVTNVFTFVEHPEHEHQHWPLQTSLRLSNTRNMSINTGRDKRLYVCRTPGTWASTLAVTNVFTFVEHPEHEHQHWPWQTSLRLSNTRNMSINTGLWQTSLRWSNTRNMSINTGRDKRLYVGRTPGTWASTLAITNVFTFVEHPEHEHQHWPWQTSLRLSNTRNMSINTGRDKRLYVCRTPGTWASTLACDKRLYVCRTPGTWASTLAVTNVFTLVEHPEHEHQHWPWQTSLRWSNTRNMSINTGRDKRLYVGRTPGTWASTLACDKRLYVGRTPGTWASTLAVTNVFTLVEHPEHEHQHWPWQTSLRWSNTRNMSINTGRDKRLYVCRTPGTWASTLAVTNVFTFVEHPEHEHQHWPVTNVFTFVEHPEHEHQHWPWQTSLRLSNTRNMSINTGRDKRLYVCRTPGTWASTLACDKRLYVCRTPGTWASTLAVTNVFTFVEHPEHEHQYWPWQTSLRWSNTRNMSINTGRDKRLYVCRTPGTWASTLAVTNVFTFVEHPEHEHQHWPWQTSLRLSNTRNMSINTGRDKRLYFCRTPGTWASTLAVTNVFTLVEHPEHEHQHWPVTNVFTFVEHPEHEHQHWPWQTSLRWSNTRNMSINTGLWQTSLRLSNTRNMSINTGRDKHLYVCQTPGTWASTLAVTNVFTFVEHPEHEHQHWPWQTSYVCRTPGTWASTLAVTNVFTLVEHPEHEHQHWPVTNVFTLVKHPEHEHQHWPWQTSLRWSNTRNMSINTGRDKRIYVCRTPGTWASTLAVTNVFTLVEHPEHEHQHWPVTNVFTLVEHTEHEHQHWPWQTSLRWSNTWNMSINTGRDKRLYVCRTPGTWASTLAVTNVFTFVEHPEHEHQHWPLQTSLRLSNTRNMSINTGRDKRLYVGRTPGTRASTLACDKSLYVGRTPGTWASTLAITNVFTFVEHPEHEHQHWPLQTSLRLSNTRNMSINTGRDKRLYVGRTPGTWASTLAVTNVVTLVEHPEHEHQNWPVTNVFTLVEHPEHEHQHWPVTNVFMFVEHPEHEHQHWPVTNVFTFVEHPEHEHQHWPVTNVFKTFVAELWHELQYRSLTLTSIRLSHTWNMSINTGLWLTFLKRLSQKWDMSINTGLWQTFVMTCCMSITTFLKRLT